MVKDSYSEYKVHGSTAIPTLTDKFLVPYSQRALKDTAYK
jgi:hypothetical protein